MIHDIALGLGAAITGITLSSFAGILVGKWVALCNPKQLRRSDEEQPLRDVHPQLLGRLSVGGQVNNLDHIVGDTDAAA